MLYHKILCDLMQWKQSQPPERNTLLFSQRTLQDIRIDSITGDASMQNMILNDCTSATTNNETKWHQLAWLSQLLLDYLMYQRQNT